MTAGAVEQQSVVPLHATPISYKEQLLLNAMSSLVALVSPYEDYAAGHPLSFELTAGQVTVQKLGDMCLVSALKIDERRLSGWSPSRATAPPKLAMVTVSVYEGRRRIIQNHVNPEFGVHTWLGELTGQARIRANELKRNEIS